jgi:tyrosyl-tRNA synthetase
VTEALIGKEPISEMEPDSLEAMRREVSSATAHPGDELIDVLVSAQLAESKSDARRLLAGNAISINGQKTSKEKLEQGDFQNGRLLIRKGKAFKDSALVELAK